MLSIPLYKIEKTNVEHREYRQLSKYVPIYNMKDNSINFSYGEDLKNWFNDRFFGRIYLIYLHRGIIYSLSNRYIKLDSHLIDKKRKFLYKDYEITPILPETSQKIAVQLQKFNGFCKSNNIKFYYLITPNKEIIYPPEFIENEDLFSIRQSIDKINPYNDLNGLFLMDAFLKAKKESNNLLFFKTEHHITDSGTFIMYKSLMGKIKKDFPNLKILDRNDFNYFYENKVRADLNRKFKWGDTCFRLKLPVFLCKQYHDYNYKYYEYLDKGSLSIDYKKQKGLRAEQYYYPSGNKLKLLIIGDSTSENLMEMLPYSFTDVYKIRINGPYGMEPNDFFKIMKNYKKYIYEFKPDIVVLCVIYAHVKRLTDFYAN